MRRPIRTTTMRAGKEVRVQVEVKTCAMDLGSIINHPQGSVAVVVIATTNTTTDNDKRLTNKGRTRKKVTMHMTVDSGREEKVKEGRHVRTPEIQVVAATLTAAARIIVSVTAAATVTTSVIETTTVTVTPAAVALVAAEIAVAVAVTTKVKVEVEVEVKATATGPNRMCATLKVLARLLGVKSRRINGASNAIQGYILRRVGHGGAWCAHGMRVWSIWMWVYGG